MLSGQNTFVIIIIFCKIKFLSNKKNKIKIKSSVKYHANRGEIV